MDETVRIRLSGHSDAFEVTGSARDLLLVSGGLLGLVYLALLLVLPRVESVEEYQRLVGSPRPAA